MPLIHSSSDQAFKSNLRAEMSAGKPQKQALAIAYSIKRGRADGGRIEPSLAQKEAGNYKKDHVRIHGLDIAIENRKGAERSGVGKGGKPWSVRMPAHYGYIKRTEGADGDHVDCYIGPHHDSNHVFVVNQRDAQSGSFDEHKCMLGFNSASEARVTYLRGFSDGKGHARLGPMKEMTVDQFKEWLKDGNQKLPARAYGGAIPRLATGGLGVSAAPWYTRQEARGMSHVGPISSIIGGRTDHHKMSVPSGAYVLPADVVSGIGQGNTGNGHAVLSKMFGSAPYGASMPGLKIGKRKFADGGEVGEATPIMAAGGEYVIDPQAVTKVGGGDLDHGHKILDAFVKHIRSKTIKTLQKLPGPARD